MWSGMDIGASIHHWTAESRRAASLACSDWSEESHVRQSGLAGGDGDTWRARPAWPANQVVVLRESPARHQRYGKVQPATSAAA